MTTETQELKACWHCNGNAAMVRAIRDGRQVFCRCGASSPPEFFGRSDKPSADQRAITAWNTRPREAELEAEVAALGAQVRSAAEAAQVVWSGEHARLEAALRPFLALARAVTVDGSPDFVHWAREAKDWTVAFSFAGHSISLGDLRALAALLPPQRS